MAMLADSVEIVIGVDTHKQTHTAAVVAAATGQALATTTMAATTVGYRQLLELADRHDGRRVWAIESTGGYGAGLTRFLQASVEQVVELDRPKRAARRHGAKSDPLDATRAAREALGREHLAQPRATGPRAALSVRLAARRSAAKPPATPNANSTHWSSPRHRPWGNGSAQSVPPRPPITARPSWYWCEHGDRSCSAAAGWARSWPPSCCAPGPIQAAAPATPPSPWGAGPRPSRPPRARRSV